MRICFIGGTGNLGYGLALRCAIAGYEVFIGSRTMEKAEEAASKMNEEAGKIDYKVVGGLNEEVAAIADLVVISLPFAAHADTLPKLKDICAGKIVVDTTVPMAYGKPPVYTDPESNSAAEGVQKALSGSKVVSGFHTISAASLSEKDRVLDCDALVCGDDLEAKEFVIKTFEAFVPRILDIGALSMAQSIERLTPLVIALNQQYKKRHVGVKFCNI